MQYIQSFESINPRSNGNGKSRIYKIVGSVKRKVFVGPG
jgi:hypothetical protein